MYFYIQDIVEGESFTAKVLLLDKTYKYFQITPETGLPFYIRYDKYTKKWKAVAEIYHTNPQLVEVAGKWISERFQH